MCILKRTLTACEDEYLFFHYYFFFIGVEAIETLDKDYTSGDHKSGHKSWRKQARILTFDSNEANVSKRVQWQF